jgi:transposase
MLGTKRRVFGSIHALTLDNLVPRNHFFRHLERTLDLGFVRELVADCYAPTGRPSIDPVVFFKLQLVMFFEGIRSERQLLAVAADRLSIRWYLGYDLDEALPDHSSLTRIRDRYGIDVFRRFFECIVEQCQQAGLVWGWELYIDATKVEANADIDTLAPRFAIEAHLEPLFAEGPEPAANTMVSGSATDPHAPTAAPIPFPVGDSGGLHGMAGARHDWLTALGRPDRSIVRGPYRRTADILASTTDADASPMRTGNGHTRLGYQDHYVVDGGRARIILTVLVAPAEVQENQPALDLLWRTRFRWRLHPYQVTGDSKYGSAENIVAVEHQQMHAYVPLSAAGHKPGRFADSDFAYDPATDTHQCPGQVTLRLLSTASVPVDASTKHRLRHVAVARCASTARPRDVAGA